MDGTKSAGCAALELQIRELIHLGALLVVDVAELADDDDLYAAGLTSHGAVHLLLALEERLAIEVPAPLLVRRTFSSIAALAGVARALARENASPSPQKRADL